MTTEPRALPSVDRLLQDELVAELALSFGRGLVVHAARETLAEARQRLRAGARDGGLERLAESVAAKVRTATRPPLRRVINATGVVIHTNLGRAPLSGPALSAMRDVASGYSNVEYDLEAGARGSRHEHVSELLRKLSGAEAALVVNNNAAALLLILATLALGREVVISRGELVEIGGGFRIPDVLRQSGAELIEVGTTNRTYVADYESAATERTAFFLRVHTSNFRVVGFAHQPDLAELAAMARARELLLIDDLGSGSFLDTSRFGMQREPLVQESVAAGSNLVCFSGDKLLGGPQAGIIVGRSDLVKRLSQHPLMRALRPDKTTLAALGATLVHYLCGEAEREVPVWRMISATAASIELRARGLIGKLDDRGSRCEILDGLSAVGGGSLPGETLPTKLLTIFGDDATGMSTTLRRSNPPVIARVERDRLVLDLRTVLPEEDGLVAEALGEVLGR